MRGRCGNWGNFIPHSGSCPRSKREAFYPKSTARPSEFREDAESTRGRPSGNVAVACHPLSPTASAASRGAAAPPLAKVPWSTSRARGPRAEASTRVSPPPRVFQLRAGTRAGHHSGRWAPADRAPVPSPRPGDTRAPRRDPLGPLPPQTAGERGPPLLCKMISLQNGKPHTVPPCWRSAPLLGAVSVPEHGGRQPGPRRESQRLTGRKLNQRERLVSAPGSTCWFGPLLKAGNVHCLNLHFFSTL